MLTFRNKNYVRKNIFLWPRYAMIKVLKDYLKYKLNFRIKKLNIYVTTNFLKYKTMFWFLKLKKKKLGEMGWKLCLVFINKHLLSFKYVPCIELHVFQMESVCIWKVCSKISGVLILLWYSIQLLVLALMAQEICLSTQI